MTRLTDAFKNKKAFIPFVTAGDPDLSTTEALIYAMEEAGASVIELGIPFSDPVAEGPVIQEADNRALAAGFRIDALFDLLEKVREKTEIPLVFLTYANPIFTYGRAAFFTRCPKASIDGVIVPDGPFEERATLLPFAREKGIALISLIAPTSHERVQMLAREAEGYIYLVSSMGVTGVREKITTDLKEIVEKIREVSNQPVAVGFGIARPEQAAQMADISDGAIVGSAIVKLVAKYGKTAVGTVRDYVISMVEAVRV